MIGYLKNATDFKTSMMLEILNYNLTYHSIYDNVSQFTVIGEYKDIEKNYVIFDDYIGIVKSCEPSDGETLIKCNDIVFLFARDALYDGESTSIEKFIADEISDNIINISDDMYKLPYINVSYTTQTPFIAPNTEGLVYNLKSYIAKVRRMKRIFLSYEIAGNTLNISIAQKTIPTRNIDFAMSDYQLINETYSANQTAKVTAINDDVTTDYYLFTDGTYSTDPELKPRAVGEWVMVKADDIDKVGDEFAKNSSSHLIEFYSNKKLEFCDEITIRSQGRVVNSYIAQISKKSNDNRYLYKSGELLNTASEKLTVMSQQIEEVKKTLEFLPGSGVLDISGGGTGADNAEHARENLGLSYQSLFNFIYPVGSVYLSFESTSPASLFGGSWTQITNRFLYAAQGSNTTGGEENHTLEFSEIPAQYLWASSKYGKTPAIESLLSTGSYYGLYSQFSDDEVGRPHNNMPPYITCYVWRRTA